MIADLTSSTLATYALALIALWVLIGLGRKAHEHLSLRKMDDAAAGGSSEPDSLHPVINLERCVGCAACTHACPEGKIIGMIGGKARLLDPGACVGHGACKTSCPVGAIELVFGTARRGVDIPQVSPTFESSVPGLYIAGELGGMGLIANAVEQGKQAIAAIAAREGLGDPDVFDVVIVGAGPAGMAATLAAKERALSSITLEQETLGGTVARYPRDKIVMTRPASLPLFGTVRLRRVHKERLIALWQAIRSKTGIEIREGIRVERLRTRPYGFEVETSAGTARARTVLLATGRRGAPRRLGVPGEDLDKVSYRLDDGTRFRGLNVIVVGGGNSAVEAALELARHPVASIIVACRGERPDRASPTNRQSLDMAVQAGRVILLTSTRVTEIDTDSVILESFGERRSVLNDRVIVCVGGTLSTELLADLGVSVERKYGTA